MNTITRITDALPCFFFLIHQLVDFSIHSPWPGEIHLDPASAPLLPVGPVDPVQTAQLPSKVPVAKQALPPGGGPFNHMVLRS